MATREDYFSVGDFFSIVVMWLLSLLISSESTVFWISIIGTGILFGLAHLPGNFAAGCKPSVMLVSTAIVSNLWVSLFCGYIFWNYGLIAAMVVHILFHVIWYPWDQASYAKISKSKLRKRIPYFLHEVEDFYLGQNIESLTHLEN